MDIRFGILGAGKIARKFCDDAIGIGAKLQAVASRYRSRAKAFQDHFAIATMYGSYGEMLADPDVDCVYVATPHGLHHEHMLACLRAGKHVLCEKAFTLNRLQAKEVFDLASQKGLFVMEAMWTRFLPVVRTVCNLIREEEIGRPISMDARFAFRCPNPPEDRVFNPLLGGGALLDVGVYPITLANLVFGIPKQIDAKARFTSTGVDGTDKIVYHYPESKAVLSASIEEENGREAKIVGTRGIVRMPGFWATEIATVCDLQGKTLRNVRIPHRVNGMEYEIEETIRCISEKRLESPIMPWRETLEILRQTDQIRSLWGFRYPGENQAIFVDLEG